MGARTFLFCCLSFLGIALHAQERTVFRVGVAEGYVEGSTIVGRSYPVEPDKEYWWLKGQRLQRTQGGYGGQVLHGACTMFYPDGQLHEAGRYLFGVKHGVWKLWGRDGRLLEVRHWRNGRLHGWSELYRPGDADAAVREKYRHGRLKKSVPMNAPDSTRHHHREHGPKRADVSSPEPKKERKQRLKKGAIPKKERMKDQKEKAPRKEQEPRDADAKDLPREPEHERRAPGRP